MKPSTQNEIEGKRLLDSRRDAENHLAAANRAARNSLVNRDLGGCGASSSNGVDNYVSAARTTDKSRGVRAGRPGRPGPRGHSSRGNHGAMSRRHGPGHGHRLALPRRRWSRLPQRLPLSKALLRIDVLGAYIVLQTAILEFHF
jgi:hypothetical protein